MINIQYTTGYAGTGKSTSLLNKLKELPKDKTIVIAPTHKAIKRLAPTMLSKGIQIEVKTIHSLLGWIPGINEKAENIHHIDVTNKLDKPLDSYTHIVIDEGGMMSEDMFYEIISKLEAIDLEDELEFNILVYLDPYQLLPVKGRQIQIDPDSTTNLTTQYRSESPDVVELYTRFVKFLEGTNKDLKVKYSDNIKELDITKFKLGDKLLAFTNTAVGKWNREIAKKLGIKSFIGQQVQLGSKDSTILCEGFIEPTVDELVSCFELGTLDLQNSKINKKFLEDSMRAMINNRDIKFIQDDRLTIYPVIVGIDVANRVLKKARIEAVKDRSKFRDVYALGRAYIMDYSFASTVHKSQGSEYKNVFVDKLDIQKSIKPNYYDTYARLMYVAISRCISKLYI